MDRIRIDQVVVVEDHGDLVCDFGQLVDQDPHQRLDGRHLRRTQRGQDPLADPLFDLLERTHQVGQERAGSLSERSRETQATDFPSLELLRPIAEQGGLAEARRGGD